ncbi:MAG: glycerophosphodiester phosphodiesterase family protein [Acidobacteriota bacterium]|nr:glycerophosphodiester phosphodiesterase [Blastocatellia bacterium]MDW8413673.1 glycerophosphodiester phosphodiesterase family protein [Acidobacteriota bacterium]
MKRPLNIAHRGASAIAPENTLPAFLLAEQLGADGVELDVLLCGSGELVVTHDDDLSILSNGCGRVRSTSLKTLKELDFGSHFSLTYAGEKIPTLQEVIDALSKTTMINVEIKTVLPGHRKTVEAVAEIISKNHLYDRVLVSSFDPLALRRLRSVDNKVRIGFLHNLRLPISIIDRIFCTRAIDALHPDEQLITEDYMAAATRRGYAVNAWTVNSKERMIELVNLGVDAIITDRPELLREILDRS